MINKSIEPMKGIIEKLKIDIRHSEYFTSPRLWITRDEAQKIIEALEQPFQGCDSCEKSETTNHWQGSCMNEYSDKYCKVVNKTTSCIHHSERSKA